MCRKGCANVLAVTSEQYSRSFVVLAWFEGHRAEADIEKLNSSVGLYLPRLSITTLGTAVSWYVLRRTSKQNGSHHPRKRLYCESCMCFLLVP